jgi:hypothetical protein
MEEERASKGQMHMVDHDARHMEIFVRSIEGEQQLSQACHGTGQSLKRIVRRCNGQVKPS